MKQSKKSEIQRRFMHINNAVKHVSYALQHLSLSSVDNGKHKRAIINLF